MHKAFIGAMIKITYQRYSTLVAPHKVAQPTIKNHYNTNQRLVLILARNAA
jgi:hypothetical protein